ncbi:sensor histidine kinase [Paenibacillus vulneris]|uniref:histidine kinase n=1 Tax=Paenibacillus vulneris TaxID=1133364 RepID=A0ABW3UQ96_9BACL
MRFVSSRKSWILMFILMLGFVDLLIALDRGISVHAGSIIYLNSLFVLFFAIFLIWRYFKEMKYIQALEALTQEIHDDWLEALPRPGDPRDEIISEALRAADRFYRRKWTDLKKDHLMEQDFITSWVHEIKAPLTTMKLAIDSNQSVPAMRKLEAEWLRIHLLVDRQLYMTRLPTLESDYVLGTMVIQRLAAQEVRELASWCMGKNIAVEFEGEEAEVITDSKWCRFIFRQILMNAVKYSPDGGTISVRTTTMPETGKVELSIVDEGPGIPAHDLPRIFDKGFTGGNGRIQNAATGLGLYLAKSVADKIGITLEAQSRPNNGTVMKMTFSARNEFESIRRAAIQTHEA